MNFAQFEEGGLLEKEPKEPILDLNEILDSNVSLESAELESSAEILTDSDDEYISTNSLEYI